MRLVLEKRSDRSVFFAFASPFLALVGIPYLSASLTTEAVIAAGGNAGSNLEVSLMLDTTGSMSGQKIEDLKLAAKDLIDIAVWADQSQYTSKIALAPFSSRVNVGAYIDKISDVQTKRTFSGTELTGITCVTERTGPEAFTDAQPVGANTLSAYRGDQGIAARENQSNYNGDGSCTNSGTVVPAIMPLTSNSVALKARIERRLCRRDHELDPVGHACGLPVPAGDRGELLADVASDEVALVLHAGGQRQCLAAGAGTEVHHLHAGLGVAQEGCDLGCFVLELDEAFLEGVAGRDVAARVTAQAPGA